MEEEEFLDRLLQIDPSQLFILIQGAIQDPGANLTVFALFLGGVTIIILLIVILLVLVFTGGEEEYEYIEEEWAEEPAVVQVEDVVLAEPRRGVFAALGGLVWVLLIAAVWVAGGYVSGRDAICVSCHSGGALHVARYTAPETDPHASVRCGSCHETSSLLASVTTAVPGRAAHFVAAIARESLAVGYGVPVANRSCAGCHQAAMEVTVENPARGLLMSHTEPLESRALCSDCHEMHAGSGVVDRYTVGMEPCMRCHDQQTASAECSFCHTKDVGYAVVSRTFLEPKTQVVDIRCGGCHDETSCDNCHGTRMPHSQEFIGAMHAREAVEDIWFNDGEMCQRCHSNTRRPCARCHKGTFPTHPPGYMPQGHQSADPFNNSCDQCHWQNAWIRGRNFCGLCHPQWNTLDPAREVNQ